MNEFSTLADFERIDRESKRALLLLRPDGIRAPRSLVTDPEWCVLIAVLEPQYEPIDFDALILGEVLRAMDEVHMHPQGESILGTYRIFAPADQFGGVYIPQLFASLTEPRRVLTIWPHVRHMDKWRHFIEAAAPQAKLNIHPVDIEPLAA